MHWDLRPGRCEIRGTWVVSPPRLPSWTFDFLISTAAASPASKPAGRVSPSSDRPAPGATPPCPLPQMASAHFWQVAKPDCWASSIRPPGPESSPDQGAGGASSWSLQLSQLPRDSDAHRSTCWKENTSPSGESSGPSVSSALTWLLPHPPLGKTFSQTADLLSPHPPHPLLGLGRAGQGWGDQLGCVCFWGFPLGLVF